VGEASDESVVITEETTGSGFTALRHEWNALSRRANQTLPFQTWEWMWQWWKHMGDRHGLAILIARRRDRLVGVAPFTLRDAATPVRVRTLRFLGSEVTDELDFIGDGADARIVWRFLSESRRRWRWNLLDLWEFPSESPSVAAVEAWARSVLRRRCLAQLVDGLEVHLPSEYSKYWMGLTPRMRAKIRTSERRTQDRFGSLSLDVATSPRDVPAALKEYLRIQKARWEQEPTGLYHRLEYCDFLRDVSVALATRGLTRIFKLSGDGQTLGLALCFGTSGRTLSYGIATDPALRHLEIGFQLVNRVIRTEIARGQRVLDFLRGREQYKSRFGARPKQVVRLRVAESGLAGRLAAMLH